MPRRSPFVIELTDEERVELEARVKEYTSPYRDVCGPRSCSWRARGSATTASPHA